MPLIFNTIFSRNVDMPALSAYLIENNISFSTIDDDNAREINKCKKPLMSTVSHISGFSF